MALKSTRDSAYDLGVNAGVAIVAALAGDVTGICMGYLAISGEE